MCWPDCSNAYPETPVSPFLEEGGFQGSLLLCLYCGLLVRRALCHWRTREIGPDATPPPSLRSFASDALPPFVISFSRPLDRLFPLLSTSCASYRGHCSLSDRMWVTQNDACQASIYAYHICALFRTFCASKQSSRSLTTLGLG